MAPPPFFVSRLLDTNMKLSTFSEWLRLRETSAVTRLKHDAARGLRPPMADYNSRSTPTPWEGEQLEKKFKKSHKKPKKDDDE